MKQNDNVEVQAGGLDICMWLLMKTDRARLVRETVGPGKNKVTLLSRLATHIPPDRENYTHPWKIMSHFQVYCNT